MIICIELVIIMFFFSVSISIILFFRIAEIDWNRIESTEFQYTKALATLKKKTTTTAQIISSSI